MKRLHAVLIMTLLLLPIFSSEKLLDYHEEQFLLQGKVILREKEVSEKFPEYYALGIIDAPKYDLYTLLTSYEKYHYFMPNVERIDIQESCDSFTVLDYTLKLPMGIRRYFKIKMSYELSTTQIKLNWHMLPAENIDPTKTIKDTRGYWLLTDYNGQKDKSLVIYCVYTDPGKIPIGMGWITKFLTEKSIPDIIINTREYIKTLK